MQPRTDLIQRMLAQLQSPLEEQNPSCTQRRAASVTFCADLKKSTHMNKIGFSFGPEVPLDGGGTIHLTPPLAGDAAQFESLAGHRLCVRVHLGTGPMTLVHCEQNTDKKWLLPVDLMKKHTIKVTGNECELTKQAAEKRKEQKVRLCHVTGCWSRLLFLWRTLTPALRVWSPERWHSKTKHLPV